MTSVAGASVVSRRLPHGGKSSRLPLSHAALRVLEDPASRDALQQRLPGGLHRHGVVAPSRITEATLAGGIASPISGFAACSPCSNGVRRRMPPPAHEGVSERTTFGIRQVLFSPPLRPAG